MSRCINNDDTDFFGHKLLFTSDKTEKIQPDSNYLYSQIELQHDAVYMAGFRYYTMYIHRAYYVESHAVDFLVRADKNWP